MLLKWASCLRLFFGRCVGEGRRDLLTRMSIKTRKFIGNTTMDPTLSLLMANLAGVRDGDLVLDPFAGTGSILLAAAQGQRRSVRLSAQSITSIVLVVYEPHFDLSHGIVRIILAISFARNCPIDN